MPVPVCNHCHKLLQDYLQETEEERKIQIRDRLFDAMQGYICVWINTMLKKWGHFEASCDILAKSWNAFLFCLKYYKPGYTAEGHFYSYTRYFLFTEYAKKDGVRIELTDLKDILHEFPTPENQHFERLLTLYQFRNVIPEHTLAIWDDAMLTLNGRTLDGDIVHCPGFSKQAYYATRKSYFNIIKLILGVKDKKIEEDKNGKENS